MLKASSDAEALRSFLMGYQNTSLTYQTYLKELERLVLWCAHVQKISISDITSDDITAYQQFLMLPEPKALWCGNKRSKRLKSGEVNPDWRPFASELSPTSIKKTMSILDSFFNYLVQTQYLKGNPLSVNKRRKKRTQPQTIERWLEKTEINTVLEALSEMTEPQADAFSIIRAKYIIHTLFYTGLRLSELTNHRMGDFTLIEGAWYLKVIGKGEKPRNIVVVDEYLDALTEFRKAIDCPGLPAFNEKMPLIPMQDKLNPIKQRRIDQILKWTFEAGARRYETLANQEIEEGPKHLRRASKLRKASAHWLRHSYGTYLVKSGCPIEKVKTLMGHSDISTTMIYVHIATNDLLDSAQGLSLQEED
ncbi:tyrosine-type recombinase/integrase [Candidatus Berkiella aquae]|nr:tyrosine-type recombinase/integrase [Candidatus Berkiella aquae]MCS5711244.1 site-specific integrase [Candidatus Berkiella aquae]